jgi:hypothetical protein
MSYDCCGRITTVGNEVYVDLEILADLGDEYLVRVGKDVLNTLVEFDPALVVRHWDGERPVVLEPYGNDAVRTREDASSTNNLENLPNVDADELLTWLVTQE